MDESYYHTEMRKLVVENAKIYVHKTIEEAARRGQTVFSVDDTKWDLMSEEFRSHYVVEGHPGAIYMIKFRI